MNPNNHLLATTGTQLMEICHLLNALEVMDSQDAIGSDKSRAEVRTQVSQLRTAIDRDFIKPIEKKLPSVLFMPPADLDRFLESKAKEAAEGEASTSSHLEFPDQFTAVLVRQTAFNVLTLLNRSSAIYEKQKNCSPESKRLFKQKIAALTEGVKEILEDLFVEQGELAVGNWKQEDWAERKNQRTQK